MTPVIRTAGYSQTYGDGAVTASEWYASFLPGEWRADVTVPGIVACHGYGGAASNWVDPVNFPGSNNLATKLAAQGYPVLACDLGGGDTWAYIPTASRINDAITYLQGTMKAKAGKVVLLGISMGGLNALYYAGTFPANVSCVVCLAPVSDIQWTVTNNSVLATAINGVYPGGYTDATYGATYNPKIMAGNSKYVGMPIQIWQGSSDTTVPPSETTAFANLVPSATVISIAGGHAESTWAEVDPVQVASFIGANT